MLKVAAWSLALILIGGAGYLAVQAMLAISFVLVPSIIALLLAALLQPVNRLLQRGHINRGWASAITLIGCIVVVIAIGATMGFVLASQFGQLSSQFRDSLQKFQNWLAHSPLPVGPDALNQLLERLRNYLHTAGSGLAEAGVAVVEATTRLIAQLLLGIFVLYFLLYDGERIWRWLTSKVPVRARPRVRAAGVAAWVTLSGYVHGTLIIAIVHSLVIGVALYLLGVGLFLPLALVVFLGSFIPIVGALIAGGLAVLITLGTQGVVPALILLAVLLLENELEAHVLQPFVVGRFVRLHPLAIVLVLAAGAWLGGIIGALFAVPVAGIAANSWRPLTGRRSAVIKEARRRSWAARSGTAIAAAAKRMFHALHSRH